MRQTFGEIALSIPKECGHHASYQVYDREIVVENNFNYRSEIDRIKRKNVKVSSPVRINANSSASQRKGEATKYKVEFTLKPEKLSTTPHVLTFSNCAARTKVFLRKNDDGNFAPMEYGMDNVSFEMDSIKVSHLSEFGELPLSMMGIVPFYGMLVFCYSFLASIWFLRSRNKRLVITPLQASLRMLVYMQLLFCSLAFSYYVHLNRQAVDINVLYSGTAAALVSWDLWSCAVALGHFTTILACQIVVTLVADGTWLIQNNIRTSTTRGLGILSAAWLLFFSMYGFVQPITRQIYFGICGFLWVIFVLHLVSKSLNHLKSLIINGGSDENVIVGGGVLVAKRSMFRKMFVVVALYPLVFVLTIIWKEMTKHDKWAW